MSDRDHVDEILDQWAQQRPELDASPISVFGRIARIDRLLEAHLASFLGHHGLTLGLFDVLAALRRFGHPFRAKPSELADSSMLTSGGMTGRLDQLESMGLVKRISEPTDRRVMFAQLTDAGLELIDNIFEEHLAREAALLADLTMNERDRLASLLRTVEATMTRDRNS